MDFVDQFSDSTIVFGPNNPLLDKWTKASLDHAKLISILFTNRVENPAQPKEMDFQQFSEMPDKGNRSRVVARDMDQ